MPSDLADLFGTKAAGSFKVNEWRTLFTVFLPIALITLWGAGIQHPTAEKAHHLYLILDHTIVLVSAVLVGILRYTTLCRAKAYRKYVTQYIGGLAEHHPHVNLHTNHHVAFHIYDFLLLFEPIRSWWCFPFEQLIGILQNLLNNHQLSLRFSF